MTIAMKSLLLAALPAIGSTLMACGGAKPLANVDLDLPGISQSEFFDDDGSTLPDVVVAVKTGLNEAFNPYHHFFRSGGPLYQDRAPSAVTRRVLERFDIGPDQILDLTITGDPDADVAADTAMLNGLEPSKFYWFKGTNVILLPINGPVVPRTDDRVDPPFSDGLPIPDIARGIPLSEATLAAASVLKANPEAIVVVVASISNTTFFDVVRRVPEIDIGTIWFDVSVSLSSSAVSAPAVIQEGKLLFAPTLQSGLGVDAPMMLAPSIVHGHSGPWWMVSVGAYEEGFRNGYALRQSMPYDFVGNHRLMLPYCNRCQTGGDELPADYFGVPGYAAGVASRVLQEVRLRLGHEGGIQRTELGPALAVGGGRIVTNWQLRRALEVAAFVPSGADYNPAFSVTNPSLFDPLRPVGPVLDDAPYQAVGWGLLSPDPAKGVVERALGALGFGAAPPDKPAAFCDFMTAYMEARFTYWDAFPSGQPGRGQIDGRDLYVSCASAAP